MPLPALEGSAKPGLFSLFRAPFRLAHCHVAFSPGALVAPCGGGDVVHRTRAVGVPLCGPLPKLLLPHPFVDWARLLGETDRTPRGSARARGQALSKGFLALRRRRIILFVFDGGVVQAVQALEGALNPHLPGPSR